MHYSKEASAPLEVVKDVLREAVGIVYVFGKVCTEPLSPSDFNGIDDPCQLLPPFSLPLKLAV